MMRVCEVVHRAVAEVITSEILTLGGSRAVRGVFMVLTFMWCEL